MRDSLTPAVPLIERRSPRVVGNPPPLRGLHRETETSVAADRAGRPPVGFKVISGGSCDGALRPSGAGPRVVAVPGSLSEEDIDYIREGYRRFADGDATFLDRFTSDATLVFPETLPKGGTYASPWEALEYFNNVGELFDNPRPEPEEFIRDGDRLVVLGQFHGRSPATGDQVAIRF